MSDIKCVLVALPTTARLHMHATKLCKQLSDAMAKLWLSADMAALPGHGFSTALMHVTTSINLPMQQHNALMQRNHIHISLSHACVVAVHKVFDDGVCVYTDPDSSTQLPSLFNSLSRMVHDGHVFVGVKMLQSASRPGVHVLVMPMPEEQWATTFLPWREALKH